MGLWTTVQKWRIVIHDWNPEGRLTPALNRNFFAVKLSDFKLIYPLTVGLNTTQKVFNLPEDIKKKPWEEPRLG